MSADQDAAAAVLAEVVSIGDDPAVAAFEADFRQAVASEVAVRPSPAPPPAQDAMLQTISGQLLTIIQQNAAIIEMMGKATP